MRVPRLATFAALTLTGCGDGGSTPDLTASSTGSASSPSSDEGNPATGHSDTTSNDADATTDMLGTAWPPRGPR